MIVYSIIFIMVVGCSQLHYYEDKNFVDFVNHFPSNALKNASAILVIPNNNSCSSCRRMTLDSIPYFLTIEGIKIVISDNTIKNIRLNVQDKILKNPNVLTDSKFLAKRYGVVTDYPVIYFQNKEQNVISVSITGSTFEGDLKEIMAIAENHTRK
ncbi:hypothetical protein [Marivirga lumbricoides]|uniref:hypothetical protein n=1 Tax=Marivirga lumbricoides TaxID=1046115 RepID=UPI0031E58404